MLFSLTNAPASFQEIIDTIFKDMDGCIWYFDDILIYGGNTEAEHQATSEKVLQQYVKHGLAVNLPNSVFHVHETKYVEHVINCQEVKIDYSKLETMSNCPISIKKVEVQVFLSFANYYWRFIINYSTNAQPFINLTKDFVFT